MMRLMISGGGTGGHVYPALVVVQTLKEQQSSQVLWVGSQGGLEKELVAGAGIPFRSISAAGLRGKNPLALLNGLRKMAQGYWQSKQLLAEYQPDVLFVTGGYVGVPVTVAAHRAGIPILIYLPDIKPGRAITFLSRYATKVAVTAPPTQAFFPAGLTVVTGYPVREALYKTNKQEARAKLNLAPDLPVLLVFGGSQGARSLNKIIANPTTLQQVVGQTQIVHISGHRDAEWTQAVYRTLPDSFKERYHLSAYVHEKMAAALAAADLIICRAGASILGEAPAVGAPAILVPLPLRHSDQRVNARYLAERGAAIIVADADIETSLAKRTLELLRNSEKRLQMSAASRKLARPGAARAIKAELEEMYHGRLSDH